MGTINGTTGALHDVAFACISRLILCHASPCLWGSSHPSPPSLPECSVHSSSGSLWAAMSSARPTASSSSPSKSLFLFGISGLSLLSPSSGKPFLTSLNQFPLFGYLIGESNIFFSSFCHSSGFYLSVCFFD